GPIQLAALLVELNLFRCESASGRNDGCDVSAVEIGADDGAVVRFGVTHVRPIEMSGCDFYCQAVRQLSPFIDDDFQIGAVGIGRQYTAGSEVKEKDATARTFAMWVDGACLRSSCAHIANLLMGSGIPGELSARFRPQGEKANQDFVFLLSQLIHGKTPG